MQNSDPQSNKFKKSLSDIKEGKEIKTDFSAEERRARLRKSKDRFSDYPTEIIVIGVLLILSLTYFISKLF
jgi:hypothetical protein